MNEFTDAIKAGDAAKDAALLDADVSLADTSENNVTPILLAIYHGRGEIVRLLVDRGARVSFAEACALGDMDRVQSMVGSASIDERSADGYPALGLAIFFRHPEIAQLLVDRGANVNAAAENATRVAPVHAAAAVQDHATMRLLLERGADANAKQQLDYTPLHTAAGRNDVEMAKLLLAHGARRDAKGSDGKTLADVAREHGQPAFAEWIEST